jgi:hypothetical protein
VPCAGFKYGDVYRLGVQFQDKWGRWSDPIYICNKQVLSKPEAVFSGQSVSVPIMGGKLTPEMLRDIPDKYVKVRAVVVFPDVQNRLTLCQGVINPTLYTEDNRNNNENMYAQSSWFFRPFVSGEGDAIDWKTGAVAPKTYISNADNTLEYTQRNIDGNNPDNGSPAYNPSNIRRVEIQGDYDNGNKFHIDRNIVTFHSPDLEFDTQLHSVDFSNKENIKYRKAADVVFTKTLSDIDI